MCGRIVRKRPRHLVSQDLGMDEDGGPDLPPHYNIPPGTAILVVRAKQSKGNELVYLRWGLIPSWAKDAKIGWKMINARAETIAEKPAFRDAFRRRRCIITADGFYEWKVTTRAKTPFFIRLRDERLMLLGGLWERWISLSGEPIETCTVITTQANDALQQIHDRMPVIVHKDKMAAWLDPNIQDKNAVAPLLAPFPSEEIVAIAVSRRVNNPRNDDADLLRSD